MKSRAEKFMMLAVQVSLAGNIILVVIKAATLVLVKSLAVATDLGISLVALIVSVMLYKSIKIASKPADFVHNYGYGKVEHVCEAMEGIIIIGIAFAILMQAMIGLVHPKHVAFPWIGMATSIIGIVINVAGGIYIGRMARISASPAIKAEALHYYLEAFISSAITVSFIVIMVLLAFGQEKIAMYIDPLAAIFVSIVISLPSFKLAKEAFFNLLDSSIEEPSKLEVIKKLSEHIDHYCEFKDLRTRNAGSRKFIELSLVLPENLSFKESHRIVNFIEKNIEKSIPRSEVRIHMEPCGMDCMHVKQKKQCPYLEEIRK